MTIIIIILINQSINRTLPWSAIWWK